MALALVPPPNCHVAFRRRFSPLWRHLVSSHITHVTSSLSALVTPDIRFGYVEEISATVARDQPTQHAVSRRDGQPSGPGPREHATRPRNQRPHPPAASLLRAPKHPNTTYVGERTLVHQPRQSQQRQTRPHRLVDYPGRGHQHARQTIRQHLKTRSSIAESAPEPTGPACHQPPVPAPKSPDSEKNPAV